jgi:hypothetical protein
LSVDSAGKNLRDVSESDQRGEHCRAKNGIDVVEEMGAAGGDGGGARLIEMPEAGSRHAAVGEEKCIVVPDLYGGGI